MESELTELCLELHNVGALKFGDFKMKSGLNSPVYFDLRVIISYPSLMDKLSVMILEYSKSLNLKHKLICGVPYTALPIASLVSVKDNVPMVMRRKEPKKYGTMKLIEGHFEKGDNCLIIEDIATSGGSILETTTDLVNDGLVVTDAIVVVDREQGGRKNLENNGIKMHSLLTLSKAVKILNANGKLDNETVESVLKYISENQIVLEEAKLKIRMGMSYSKRASLSKSPMGKKIFDLMEKKETNLCFAIDATNSKDVLSLADSVGPNVCIVKTHNDCVSDWNSETENKLKELSLKHDFIVMEDRKFGDIGNTVRLQCEKVFPWCDLVTMHSIGGSPALSGAVEASKKNSKPKGAFLVAELSSKGNLISPSYTQSTVEMGENESEFVVGFVCQNPSVVKHPGFLQLTPGVSTQPGADSLGQQYCKPEDAVLVKGGDIIVVGRAIYNSPNPKETSRTLKEQLWSAYKQRTST